MNNLFLKANKIFPVDIVLAPCWWYKNSGITFDSDFFYHPDRRVEVEKKMEAVLYNKWGQYGLGGNRNEERAEIGPVHLAAGYLLQEMIGCKVNYKEDSPPEVIPADNENLDLDIEQALKSNAFIRFNKLLEELKLKYNTLKGDINWSGILNIALDFIGQDIFIHMYEKPNKVKSFFNKIKLLINKFTMFVSKETGTTSISVNRNLINFNNPVFLHSECSHTMISVDNYNNFLLDYDIEWSKSIRPFGIHYCGPDPHRYAESFSMIPNLDFLDLGWGGNITELRKYLPNTFFNLRLSPVELIDMDVDVIRSTIIQMAEESGNPQLTGFCCINMDDNVSDKKITAIFQTVKELRNQYYKTNQA